jgi:GNAT superfamily N-acetyltransferase
MTEYACVIEALSGDHDRRAFSCGEAALDEYLRRFARQHGETKISRTYVACQGRHIVGYYTLAMAAIRKEQLPEAYQSRFPNFPLPVARLARLAVDTRQQRQGYGELLLADALHRCYLLSEQIGMIGVVVDAKDERALAYYRRYEFVVLPDTPLTLWLPAAAIAKLIQ